MKPIRILIPVLCGLLFLASACTRRQEQGRGNGATGPARTAPRSGEERAEPAVGFRDPERLAEHYRKHGAEFGTISREEYLRRAQVLRDAPAGGSILEFRRADGVTTRFDRTSGAFIAFDPDRTIRTFFHPNDGEAYFLRQRKRSSR